VIIFNSKDVLGFEDLKFMLIGIPLVSLMINLILFGELIEDGLLNVLTICQLIAILYTFIFWQIFRQLYLQVTRRHPGYANANKRYMLLIPLVIIGFFVVKYLLNITLDPFLERLSDVHQPKPIVEAISSFTFLILINIIYEGAHLFVELKASQLEKEKLIKANISSQLEGLKSQVNPHFLFNSLNTLASIIPEDQEKSVRYVNKLSKVYRYILEIGDKELVTVAEELNFLKSYTFLLEERFGDNFKIDIDVPKEYHTKYVIPLALQITFENAIKHNVISKKQPLYIKVHVKNALLLAISNNLQKKKTIGFSPGLGLQNIKNRYKFFTRHEVVVEETAGSFVVGLPLLNTSKFL